MSNATREQILAVAADNGLIADIDVDKIYVHIPRKHKLINGHVWYLDTRIEARSEFDVIWALGNCA